MDYMTSSHEVLVCQTCGDKGFTNAFIYCVKCLRFVIHRYCLNVIPKSFDEIVEWVCEDCQQPLSYPSTSHKLIPSRSHKQNATSSPQVKKKKRKKKPKKKPKVSLWSERRKILIKEFRLKKCVLGLEAPSKGDNKRKRDESFLGVEMKENKTLKRADSIEHSCCDSSSTDVNSKNKDGIQEPETSPDIFHSFQKHSANQMPPKENKGQDETSNQMHNLQNVQEIKAGITGRDATQSTVIENNAEYIDYEPAKPVLDPVWRGSFDITQTDYNLFEGFVGHLSNKACYKVCEEANVLPSLLSLEMHPKTTLWPKSFLESHPSDENIALYFFPGDIKNERDYEDLVGDMIDEDLAMRAPAKNADLLIFTSRVLPRPFWRFQGKNYLWGVFRGKKNYPTVFNNSEKSEKFPNEVTSNKETITKLKTFDSQSPQSPLCNYR
ncbi:hypothetical protein L1887_43599 [Cichorium endivia]|nr:hypothetical protein L1887_43599 [Cichorium endivia]